MHEPLWLTGAESGLGRSLRIMFGKPLVGETLERFGGLLDGRAGSPRGVSG